MKKQYSHLLAIILLISVLIFAVLIKIYLTAGSFIFDSTAINYVYRIRSPYFNRLFILITTTGNVFSVILISLASSVILYNIKKKSDAVFFAANILGLWLSNELLKYAFRRQRPSDIWIVKASGYSFPSGHAMIFMGFSIIAIFYILKLIKNKKLSLLISILIFIYSLLVGLSRVYLGVHYLSDVFAGWSAGIAWSSFSIAVNKFLKKSPV